jgi:hypothetical protein
MEGQLLANYSQQRNINQYGGEAAEQNITNKKPLLESNQFQLKVKDHALYHYVGSPNARKM